MVMELARLEGFVQARSQQASSDWVTVAEAADKAGVSTSTVRQWYRSGRLATQRAGEGGAFLVPIDDVILLADAADAEGDAVEDTVLDINAAYWSAETEAARAEAAAVTAEADRLADALDDAVERADASDVHVAFLREQVRELGEDGRKLRARVAELEEDLGMARAEMKELRRSSTYASLTDHGWLDGAGDGYRGPARRQEPLIGSGVLDEIAVAVDAGDLSDPTMLAELERIDDETVLAGMHPIDEEAAVEAPPAPAWTASDFGHSDDDLLPRPEPQTGKRRK